MFNNNFYNPQQIIRVNGQNGAQAFNMPLPNSSALLLDENDPIVWLVMTDGAGYKSITPYKIEQYIPEPEPDFRDLINRIERLEAKINESNNAAFKQGKQSTTGTAAEQS